MLLEGILGILKETYESSAEGYREWLTEYMSPQPVHGVPGKAAEAGEPGGAGEEFFDRGIHGAADRPRAA